jgi:hypothetical protein
MTILDEALDVTVPFVFLRHLTVFHFSLLALGMQSVKLSFFQTFSRSLIVDAVFGSELLLSNQLRCVYFLVSNWQSVLRYFEIVELETVEAFSILSLENSLGDFQHFWIAGLLNFNLVFSA